MNCECFVKFINDNDPNENEIVFCPIHSSAEVLLEALKQVQNNLIESGLDENDFGPTLRILKQAIAKAEGTI